MKYFNSQLATLIAALCAAAGIAHPSAAFAQASIGGVDVAQQPLFTASGQPPLNMLVMGKDHKIYYEAYNDASDLNGDGALDIGYKPAVLDYYGYFNSDVCYTYSSGKFVPSSAASSKQCSGKWSGDFLNYLTTSRLDALRRVLYGGWRQTDTATETVLQGAFLPQDGHSWGKEYQSLARDGYEISSYAPLTAPDTGKYILFAVTTTTGIDNSFVFPSYQAPLLRVLKNTDKRVWNWLSIEGPVAGNKCFTSANTRVDCVGTVADSWSVVPASMLSGLSISTWKTTGASPTNLVGMDSFFSTNNTTGNLCGTGAVTQINVTGSDNNPFVPGTNACTHNNYMTVISGQITVPTAGTYRFGVDGDDAVDVAINGTVLAGWYGGHGNDRSSGGLDSHSNTIVLTAGTHNITFRHQDGTGGDNWGLFMKTLGFTTTRDDYLVRVESCPAGNAALRESTCKLYPNGQYKPTGILHDYGEAQRMYFGLITGSQFNNLEGGVLRRNISDFASEINPTTGVFRSNVNGIANAISGFRMIGGGYNDSTTDNIASDSNWNWANGNGSCPSMGDTALGNGQCRMWGNPLGEMVYESMRYFAGAAAPTSRFETGGSTKGTNEETAMNLHKETWKDPYAAAPAGGGYLSCSRPFQTIISDINPSYDGDVPGSPFTDAITTTSITPASIGSFSLQTEGQAIWNAEAFGTSKSVFIGDNNNVTDGAPTAKLATSFGNIRGLAPEEPTKGGTYSTSAVARFARLTDLNAVTGQQNLSTYSIALASPLPRIDFPIGGGKITLLPFAKTASGTFGTGTRKPTNTIVDFYVEKIANLPGQPSDSTVNGGLAYAVFRINYEDVEQGNDHDMDAIVRYLVAANADGTVTVSLSSEYAAGSADQNMGYVMSGTTQDGVYLDVKDTDSGAGSFLPYALNTPNPVLPGGCGIATPPVACASQLPLTSTRIFTPSTGVAGGTTILNDPLWYAAKYGAPKPAEVDLDGNGVPDNYFLVTNPATLRTQLDKAFSDIINNSQPTASVATSTPRYVPGATLAYEASYKSNDWSGDIQAFKLSADATYNSGGVAVWSASANMPAPGARKVFTARPVTGGFTGTPFTTAGLNTAMQTTLMSTLPSEYTVAELIAYLKGDQSKEQGVTGCTVPANCPYRKRSSKVGDILNSSPAVVGVTSYGYGSILSTVDATAAGSYAAYVDAKKSIFGTKSENPIVFVGANDGMLHAFDGREGTGGGVEQFAYIPNAVLGNLNELARPGYVHRYFVDGTPTVTDAYLGTWKTVLAASTGAGARAVYALDVSDPRNFAQGDVMWEFNNTLDGDMGQFVGRPYIGVTEGNQWVAAFGNGLNSDRQRAVLFVVDLATGALIQKIDTGVGCLSTDAACTEGPNGLATAVLVDNSGNGAADTIYAGDYQGNMWRFELGGGSWSLGNSGKPIFKATDPTGKKQSITSGAYTVANPLGGTMVIFGTGRYLNANDADETQLGLGSRPALDSLYGIWDSRSYDDVNNTWTSFFPIATTRVNVAGEFKYADLEQQKITSYNPLGAGGINGYRTGSRNPVDFKESAAGTGKLGWYLDLKCSGATGDCLGTILGERVTASPQGILSDVIFNTFRPEGDTCEPGSLNATMVLDALTGAADYIPLPPSGGWGTGMVPPTGKPLSGTDTVRGPPPGEPPIVVIRPPTPAVPCLPGSTGCVTPPPPCTPGSPGCEPPVTGCSWRSPNSAGRPPGKAIPCGRISWKQIR